MKYIACRLQTGNIPFASVRLKMHSSRCVHSFCWLNCLRFWHSSRFDSFPKNNRVLIVTPWPQVLLHGDQSDHGVTGQFGSGISISLAEHSGCMHLFFSTIETLEFSVKFSKIFKSISNYQLKYGGTSSCQHDRRMFVFSSKYQYHMTPSMVNIPSMVLFGKHRPLHQHCPHWLS